MTDTNVRDIDITHRGLIRLSLPVIISLVAQNLIGVVDTAFIGRLGEVQLGGTSMAGLVYFSIYTIGYGLASGAQILIGQRYGAGRTHEIGHVLGQSLLMLLIAALGLLLVTLPFGSWLFGGLLSSPHVAEVAIEYWDYRSLGFLFGFVGSGFRAFFVGISRTKVLTYAAIVMSAVNILLDYLLIFGHLGAPALGVKGAAIASVIAECSAMLFYLVYMWRRVDLERFGVQIPEIFRPDGALIRTLFGLSIYLVLQALVSQSVWTVFFFMIESLGERELAIASIVKSMYILLYMPINSFGTAVRATVSQLIGAGQRRALRLYMKRSIGVSAVTMLVVIFFIQAFPSVPLRIFTDNMDLVSSAIPSLRVITFALLICSMGNMYFGALSATGATKVVFVIELLNTVFYLTYSAIMVYGLGASIAACFSVEVFYYLFIWIMSYYHLRKHYF